MKGYIDNIDFVELEPMKYWSFGASTSMEARRDTIRNAIFGGDYIGSLKVDGFYQRLVKDEDGNCFMIARSRNVKGEVVDKYEWVPQLHSFMDSLPNGTCFLSEAYIPNAEGSKNVTSILGCLKDKAIFRQQTTPLHFHIFDCMAFDNKSLLDTEYEKRVAYVNNAHLKYDNNEYVHFTSFYVGEALWGVLQSYLAEGREGMVIMRKDAKVYQKRTPARVSIKIKKELQDTIDCFFTGRAMPPTRDYSGKEIGTWKYWEDIRTGEKFEGELENDYSKGRAIRPVTKSYFYGMVGSLEIGVYDDNHEVIGIGYLSNLTEEIKLNPNDYTFKPLEVTAMQLDTSNPMPTLRHGKLLGFRTDISIEDCTLSKFLSSH